MSTELDYSSMSYDEAMARLSVGTDFQDPFKPPTYFDDTLDNRVKAADLMCVDYTLAIVGWVDGQGSCERGLKIPLRQMKYINAEGKTWILREQMIRVNRSKDRVYCNFFDVDEDYKNYPLEK